MDITGTVNKSKGLARGWKHKRISCFICNGFPCLKSAWPEQYQAVIRSERRERVV